MSIREANICSCKETLLKMNKNFPVQVTIYGVYPKYCEFMLTISFTIFTICFIAELNNTQILALAFEVNTTQVLVVFYIKVNMLIGKLQHESENSCILLNKQSLMEKTEVSWFRHFQCNVVSKSIRRLVQDFLNFPM